MRVLFLAPQPFFTDRGTPIAVRAAVEVLAGAGHEIDLLTYHEGEDVEIPGVRIRRIERPPLCRRVPIGPSWQKVLCDAALARLAFRTAASRSHDVVHAVEEAVFIALHLHRRLGTPFVYDMDSLMSEQLVEKSRLLKPAAWIFSALEARSVRRSAGVLAVCPALMDKALGHRPGGEVALLHDFPLEGVGDGEPAAELEDVPGPRLLYVGNLEAYQGVDLALRAFRRVAPRFPTATVIVVGGKPDHLARYRQEYADLVEGGRVRFLGPRPVGMLGSLLAAADILLSPRTEGRNTPMKIYSYLESGKPVLATRLSTHTQVLSDGVACLVSPDEAGMTEGLARLLESPDLRRELGDAGRELVRKSYSKAAFRSRLVGFYESLAKRLKIAG